MPKHFRSREAYDRYTAYVNIHHLSKHHPKYNYIAGKKVYVHRRKAKTNEKRRHKKHPDYFS